MIDYAKSWIVRVKQSTLGRNSVWMFLGYGLRIIVQAGYFILIARALGPREYGAFVGTTALIAIAAPFAGAGAGNLLIKNVSRDKSLFAVYWGNALFLLCVSGLALMGDIKIVSHWILPPTIPMLLIVVICLSDMIGARINDFAANAFQAMDQMNYTASVGLLPFTLRLISAAIIISVWHHASAMTLGWFYLGSTAISCVVGIVITNWKLGAPLATAFTGLGRSWSRILLWRGTKRSDGLQRHRQDHDGQSFDARCHRHLRRGLPRN